MIIYGVFKLICIKVISHTLLYKYEKSNFFVILCINTLLFFMILYNDEFEYNYKVNTTSKKFIM